MSAIWGHISFRKTECTIESMASEYKRKCKLDKISEVLFKNALIGAGIQFINPEDRHEEMPYIIDDGDTMLVADCILDNRDELIEELLNSSERPSDVAEISSGRLICKAYEKWHDDLARHLRGFFSIAIYNAREEKLFLCVDQCACRCLNYYVGVDDVFFSTLLSPIRQAAGDIEGNEQYILDYLCLPGLLPNISSMETPWKGALKILPYSSTEKRMCLILSIQII